MKKQFTILLVDDEAGVVNSLVRNLRSEKDWEIVTADSGENALPLIAEKNVDLIISDNRMPGMTGVELFKRVKNTNPDIHRILLSGYSDTDALISAINDGEVYRFIAKPWDNQELVDIIQGVFRQQRIIGIARSIVDQFNSTMRNGITLSAHTAQDNPNVYLKINSEKTAVSNEVFTEIVDSFMSGVIKGENGLNLNFKCLGGMITKHAGNIVLELDMGKGAKLLFELPMAPKSGDAPALT
jgi:adenylate cyclase